MAVTIKEISIETVNSQTYNKTKIYPSGEATYTVIPETLTSSTVFITCKTLAGGKYSSQFTYHYDSKKITNWLEFR